MTAILAVGAPALTTILRVPEIPARPTKTLALDTVTISDGMAVSAAFAAHRLGARAAFWGRSGDDATGRRIRDELAAAGLDVSGLRLLAGGRGSVSSVQVDPAGERNVTVFHDPALDADPSWLPLAEIGKYDAVMAEVRWVEGAEAVLAEAGRRRIPAILDADLAPRMVLERLVPLASHAVFSAAGLSALEPGPPDGALARVAARFPGFVGVTLGAEGFLWLEGGALRRAPALPVAAVDTLAAGDVFHGAFALAVAEGKSAAECARFANAAAALKCTRFGGRLGAPSRVEVEALLARA